MDIDMILACLATLGIGGAGVWVIMKRKITELADLMGAATDFIVMVRDATYDDNVDEAEFRDIVASGKALINMMHATLYTLGR